MGLDKQKGMARLHISGCLLFLSSNISRIVDFVNLIPHQHRLTDRETDFSELVYHFWKAWREAF